MKICNQTKFNINEVTSEEVISFSDDITVSKILEVFDYVIKYESSQEKPSIVFELKNLSTNHLIELYKFCMKEENINIIKNQLIIFNISLLLKSYNTFDSSFFEHKDVFISSLDKFLDIKLALQKEIGYLNKEIAVYFYSILRSLNKITYTMLDSYVTMPYFFQAIFTEIDIITISGILSTVPSDANLKLGFVKNANVYMSALCKKYLIADNLLSQFLKQMKG